MSKTSVAYTVSYTVSFDDEIEIEFPAGYGIDDIEEKRIRGARLYIRFSDGTIISEIIQTSFDDLSLSVDDDSIEVSPF